MTPNGFARPGTAQQPSTATGPKRPVAPRGAEKRSERRYFIKEPALLIVGKRALTCELCDISFGGAMLEGQLPLQVGDLFRLMVLDLPELQCRVAHAAPGFLGVSFTNGKELHHDLGEWIRGRCAAS